MNFSRFVLIFLPLLSLNCGNKKIPEAALPTSEFTKYWYAGKAEITSYKLFQARYGAIHQGSAVTIFVTEDFSKTKHVKPDHPEKSGNDAVHILKLNLTKKFNTGVYPYSMMLSVFKPIDIAAAPHPFKVTASSQEWCGHTFTQIDLEKDAYKAKLFSYFESEGDHEKKLPLTWMEDELWALLRIQPEALPTGTLRIIPGLLQQRLLHSTMQAENATATLETVKNKPLWLTTNVLDLSCYSVSYPQMQRSISIYFQQKFPYTIEGWEETYLDPFGKAPKVLETKAVKLKTILSDYWNHHNKEDQSLRDSLGLD